MKLFKILTPAVCIAMICISVTSAKAQLSSGSLGDPVVNITFGSGSNPGPRLNSQATSYSYTSACPSDGSYSILNSVSCSAWHSLREDHTPGDVNGYMMVVNSSYDPGVFYVDTVRQQLCENTTYQFAAWILNFNTSPECGGNSINPNITFSIETVTGTVLQTYQTGNIPVTGSPSWVQYGFTFSTPGVTSVVIRMVNNAPGGCGNDVALDDITFRPVGPMVNSAIVGSAEMEVNVCENIPTVYTLNGNVVSNDPTIARQWQLSTDSGATWTDIPGATSPQYIRPATGKGVYKYRLSVAPVNNLGSVACRTASNVITININPLPVPVASSNTPVCEEGRLVLTADDGNTYAWSGPQNFTSTLPSPVIGRITKAQAGTYQVIARSAKGCEGLPAYTTVVVNENPLAGASAASANICRNSSTRLTGTGNGTYKWIPSTGLSTPLLATTDASPADTTTYSLIVTNTYGCSDTATTTINVLPLPVANAGPDQKIFEGETILLKGDSGLGVNSFYWTSDAEASILTELHPVITPARNTTYTLHVSSALGCGISSDDVFIRVFNKVKIPNSFSPNGDGINDLWQITALSTYPDCDLMIFNRSGQKVYSSRGYYAPWNGKWNGKDLPADTYYYLIDLKIGTPKLSGWLFLVH